MIHFSSAVGVPLLHYNSQIADNKSRATKSKVDRARGVSRKENLTRTSSWGRPTSRNPMKTAEEVSAECMACLSTPPPPPERHRNFTSITRSLGTNGRERRRRRKEGATEQSARARMQAFSQAGTPLTLYELNCSASRKSFITDEALRKLLPISTPK